ncbi:MAG: hypothetical protein GY934_21310 [Gammaproteobacteria bacterium]|nr:hypothetical protein [Gammaproteobacteria bacterium]
MTTPYSLLIDPIEHSAGDFVFLRQEGIHYLERLAGELWTDFNTHDPGITILEQLCYAITDLGYRIDHELPDLLAEGGRDAAQNLYTPAQILTSHPVTITDLRKLLLDVKGVKNVWIERVDEPDPPLHYHPGKQELSLVSDSLATEPVQLKGLFRVLIEKSDLEDRDTSSLKIAVAHRLHACRNLCEEFEEIKILQTQMIQIDARIDIGPVEDATELLASVYKKIEDYLSPSLPFFTLEQMIAQGKRIEMIFDGPQLAHGFIDTQTLEKLQRRTSIYASDLINEIMSVPGVRAVGYIRILSDGRREAWALELNAGQAPKFDAYNTKIQLHKDELKVQLNATTVIERFFELLKHENPSQPFDLSSRDIPAPTGRDRTLSNYFSIQHQFPLAYGVGAHGLPATAPLQRKAEARQLKAYLMFFDQLLANYFSQLAHMGELFSFQKAETATYFSQLLDEPDLDLDAIRRQEKDAHRNKLQEITEESVTSKDALQRKNRFLNHLLARFSEQFTDYSLLLFSTMPESEALSPADKLVRDKQAFLQHYPRISSARGTASNYLKPWGPDNLSGLEERLQLKLGLSAEEDEQLFIVEHILLRAMADDKQQDLPILAAARVKDPYSLQLSLLFPDWPIRFKDPAFKQLIEQTVREETPAHLTAYIHWLDKESIDNFIAAHQAWLAERRRYWLVEKIGTTGGDQ